MDKLKYSFEVTKKADLLIIKNRLNILIKVNSMISNIDQIIQNIVKIPDQVKSLNRDDTEEILCRVKKILDKERALIELSGDSVFVGDTHGDFETTKSIIERFFDANNIIFLGDYVDRAPIQYGSLYNLMYLLIIKCYYPEKIILLKGNHETDYCLPCGFEFKIDVIEKYGSPNMTPIFEEVFRSMPLMVRLNNVFAAHGGIPKGMDLNYLKYKDKDDLNLIKPITWDDPDNSRIIHGNTFTEEELIQFLKGVKAKVFIRGHNYDTQGFSIYRGKCLTIFSSRMFQSKGNGGILIAKTNGNIKSTKEINLWDFSTGKWIIYKLKTRK